MRILLLAAALVAAVLFLWSPWSGAAGRAVRDRAGDTSGTPAHSRGEEEGGPGEEGDPTAPGLELRVRVVDPDARPVEGARVLGREAVLTDAEGRCRVIVAPAAWTVLRVDHPDFVLHREWLRLEGDGEVTLTLSRGALLTVVVLGPDRRPLEGALVAATRTREHGAVGFWRWTQADPLAQDRRTDAGGRVRVGAMPEGEVGLTVDLAPYARREETLRIVGVAPVEHLVVLDHGATLLGSVRDPAGEPVAGATVRVLGAERPVTATAADGTFRLEGVPEGSVQVGASAEGHGPGTFGDRLGWGEAVPIPVRAGEVVSGIDIELNAPSWLVGKVVDDRDAPVAGVSVQTWSDGISYEETTGADGRFRMGPLGLREARWIQLWFNAGEHRLEAEDRQVEPGKDTDFGTLRATRLASVRGRVLDPDGNPAAAGTVLAHPGYRSGPIRADGTFEVGGITPGTATLVARTARPLSKSPPVLLELAPGEVKEDVEIRALPTASISGRVVTPEGEPRQGVIVGIKPLDAPQVVDPEILTSAGRILTGAEGRFAFQELPPGRYAVGVTGTGSAFVDSGDFEFLHPPSEAEPGATDLEILLPFKGAVVSGRVLAKRDGLPIPEFEATFLKYRFLLPNDADLSSFADGTFRYELAEPGKYAVEITASGFAPVRTEAFALAEGERKDLGVIRLGDGGTIRGVCRDAQGRPVPYVRINILNAKFQTNEREPFTDRDGRFELRGVSPDLYTVFAVSPSHPIAMARGVAVKEAEVTEVDLHVLPPAPLTILVTDEGGHPIEGATLNFTFQAIAPLTSSLFRSKIPPGAGTHESDAEGVIVQRCLPPGPVTVGIDAEGFATETKQLDLTAGEPNRVEFRLRREPQ